MQGDLYFREAKRLIDGAEPKDDPRQWSNRGDSLVALGRHEEGIASYRRAIELDPAFHQALSRKGRGTYRIRRLDKRLERLRAAAIVADPRMPLSVTTWPGASALAPT